MRELLRASLPQEILPTLSLDLAVLVIVGLGADQCLPVEPVVLVEPVAQSARVFPLKQSKHSHPHVGKETSRVLRPGLVHQNLELLQRALPLQRRLEPVHLLKQLNDLVKRLAITEDCPLC